MIQYHGPDNRRDAYHEGQRQREVLPHLSHEEDGHRRPGSRHPREYGEALGQSEKDHVLCGDGVEVFCPRPLISEKKTGGDEERADDQGGGLPVGEGVSEEKVQRQAEGSGEDGGYDDRLCEGSVEVSESLQKLAPELDDDRRHRPQVEEDGVGEGDLGRYVEDAHHHQQGLALTADGEPFGDPLEDPQHQGLDGLHKDPG